MIPAFTQCLSDLYIHVLSTSFDELIKTCCKSNWWLCRTMEKIGNKQDYSLITPQSPICTFKIYWICLYILCYTETVLNFAFNATLAYAIIALFIFISHSEPSKQHTYVPISAYVGPNYLFSPPPVRFLNFRNNFQRRITV